MRLILWLNCLILMLILGLSTNVFSEEKINPIQKKNTQEFSQYLVQPGDVLDIKVWREEQLQVDALIRPDGYISFPLAGDIYVRGKTFEQIQSILTDALKEYMPNLWVTVSAKQLSSNRIFVMGQVNKPGDYPIIRSLDVIQALALAGGVTPYADVNDIRILRRDNYGNQRAIIFKYGDIEKGIDLKQNIILQSGDSVIVP